MSKSQAVLIVESPAKAGTIAKYLKGSKQSFKILASYGHVRDLVAKTGAVDTENDFKMKYQAIEKNAKHFAAIAEAVKKADTLYLATDPDREGEAIAWHVCELLKSKKLLKDKKIYRVVFHEITKTAVQEAIANPRELAIDLINAQQARRALDYLVGFNLSPLLWKKVRRGLSAGRVQSPALRMIVEREEEIEKFISQEYWTILADLISKKQPFTAKLVEYNGEKLTQFYVENETQASKIQKELTDLAKGKLTVHQVEKKQRKRHPAPPFITSTLQQEAGRKLGFTTQRTMRIAQQLYEGIDIGQGPLGLITYMRTDSVNLSMEALQNIRALIEKRYGKDNVPEEIRFYRSKSKNAQEAHEAIRPTSVDNLPDAIKSFLTPEQFKLYQMIWKRTVACQMISATVDTVAVDFLVGPHRLRANGSTIAIPGFLSVYEEGRDEKNSEDEEALLPVLKIGDIVDLKAIRPEQHFTEPPPRYTEASLVKALEEHDIGRPSTYTSIISTLQKREYVLLEQKRFRPTDVGRIVKQFLSEYFTRYVDYGFTAQLEDQLDAVSRGENEWIPLLKDFWDPFKEQIDKIEETVQRKDVTHEALEEACPKCAKPLSIRLGRRGRFIGCTGYPECDYTRNLNEDADTAAQQAEVVADRQCPTCESPLVIKQGRYGRFIGCSKYPECKYLEPLEKPADTGVPCPECKQGSLLKRKSRFGKIFFSCGRYPDCKYAIWNEPVAEPCPKCDWPLLTLKTTKRRGSEKVCPQKGCGYAVSIEERDAE